MQQRSEADVGAAAAASMHAIRSKLFQEKQSPYRHTLTHRMSSTVPSVINVWYVKTPGLTAKRIVGAK
jgi:hypothetical protein